MQSSDFGPIVSPIMAMRGRARGGRTKYQDGGSTYAPPPNVSQEMLGQQYNSQALQQLYSMGSQMPGYSPPEQTPDPMQQGIQPSQQPQPLSQFGFARGGRTKAKRQPPQPVEHSVTIVVPLGALAHLAMAHHARRQALMGALAAAHRQRLAQGAPR